MFPGKIIIKSVTGISREKDELLCARSLRMRSMKDTVGQKDAVVYREEADECYSDYFF